MIALGIDIGGTRIKAGLVDESGRVIAFSSTPTPGELRAFRQAMLSLVRGLPLPATPLAGVGIGCKGLIQPQTTLVEVLPGTLSFLEGEVLSDFVAPALPWQVSFVADNDARVAMAGEMAWGAAKGRLDVLMLTLGTGVGGAIVTGGKLMRGATGVAGHLGHVTVDPDGPACICGNHGCLETLFSAHAIETEAYGIASRGCDTRLTELFRKDPRALTCQAVFQAAYRGDRLAKRIIDRATRALGAALAGLLIVFDPEIAIIGGQISEAGEPLLAALREEVAWRTRRMLRREVPIVSPQVAGNAGILGAAALVYAER